MNKILLIKMEQENTSRVSVNELKKRQEEKRLKVVNIDRNTDNYKALAWTCVIIGFLVAMGPLFSSEKLGFNGYGDFFGGTVAGIWSLGGIIFIYIAFLGQKQQLMNQQIELIQNQIEMRATQIELKGQKIELEEQNKLFSLQRFETTFFNLLKVQNDISLTIDRHLKRTDGENFFEMCSKSMETTYEVLEKKKIGSKESKVNVSKLKIISPHSQEEVLKKYSWANTPLKMAQASYMELFSLYHNALGHYFRHLYHILKFIKEKEQEELDKESDPEIVKKKFQRYADLLQAELSSFQLKVLFYNCLCFKNMKKLVHHFNFLENFSSEDLIRSSSHVDFFLESKIDGEVYPKIEFKKREDIIVIDE